MQKKVTYIAVLIACLGLFVVPGLMTGLVGCEAPKKDKCASNLDCEADQACVTTDQGKDCKPRGELGDSCKDDEPPCKNKDSDGKQLLCDPADKKCKHRCETNLDCDIQGQVCNTDTGICEGKSGTKDGGPSDEPPTEGNAGQKIGEACGKGQKCASSLDCVTLGDQEDGTCWATCKADGDCKEGRICASGHCVPNAGECIGTPGGQLTKPCWAGLECLFESAGGGRCFRTCTKDSECSTGLKCTAKGNKKYCLSSGDVAGPGQECGNVGGKNIGCSAGYQCSPERVNAKKKICTKECKSDAECSWPRFCSQICTLGTVGTAKIGQVCEVKAGTPDEKRCDGGLDCLNLQKGGGLCYRSCKDGRADPCPTGTECVALGTEKYCMKKCADPKECAAPTPTCGQLQGVQGQYCTHGTK